MEEGCAEEDGLVMAVRAGLDGQGGTTITWEQVKEESVLDRVCRELVEAIREGFPERRGQLEEVLRPFHSMRGDLYELKGVPFLHGRMLVPKYLRRQVLDILHKAH